MKDAFSLLPTVMRRLCRMCRLSDDWQERLWTWYRDGISCDDIAERLAEAGVPVDKKAVARHKRHLSKALERFVTLQGKSGDDATALKLQLQVEMKRLMLLKLSRTREERVKLALSTLREVLGETLYRKAEAFLQDIIAQAEGSDE